MKKKIFVDGRAFDTEYQGTRTYIKNIYTVVDEIGDFDIIVASEDPYHTASFFKKSKNIRFIPYTTTSSSKLNRAFKDIPMLIKKYGINAAHFQYVIAPSKRTFQIVTIHDLLFKDFPEDFSFYYRFTKNATFYISAKYADLITTVSEYSQNAISKHFDIDKNKIHVLHNGVAEEYYHPYDKSAVMAAVQEKFQLHNYLLYVSRIEPRKNHINLVKSFVELELFRTMQMVFIGKESIPVKELHQFIKTLNEDVKRKIIFLNNVPDEDLKLIYQAAKLFIYPSKSEGFGIPPLEAGALKLPTICSNTTAMASFSFFGGNLIYPSVEALKKAISENLIECTYNTDHVSKTIKQLYSWESSAQKFNTLLVEALNT